MGIFTAMCSIGLTGLACDDEAKPKAAETKEKAPEKAPEPDVKSPPHFVIGEDGASVRSTSVEGGKKSGLIATPELDVLKNALADEKDFIDGKEVKVVIDRKAKRGWVGSYFVELERLGATKLTVLTETRKEFPGQLDFALPNNGQNLEGCTMIGQVTKHNGSALWLFKGGTAKERGPGLGGPDLSMAKEVFAKNYKKCESNTFLTDGENEKNWGFIFDMAAAALSTPEVKIERALLPASPQTPGRPVKL